MKKFKIDMFKFTFLPIMILIIMGIYIYIFFKEMPMYVNVLNISLDIVFIILYFRKFIFEINLDPYGMDIRGFLIKKRILSSEIESLNQSSFLTLIKTEKGRFYILSSKKERETIKKMFSDMLG